MSDFNLPDNLPGLNLEYGLSLMGGSKDKYINLLKKFLNNYKTSIKDIKKFIADDDIKSAHRIAHTLKGISGNIGAKKLFISSGLLESSLKNGYKNEFMGYIVNFENDLKELLNSISFIAEKYNSENHQKKPAGNSNMNISKVISLMKELKILIEGNYSNSIEVLSSIKEEAYNSDFYSELIEIEKFLDKYDFENAGILLQKTMNKFDIS